MERFRPSTQNSVNVIHPAVNTPEYKDQIQREPIFSYTLT